MCWRLFACAVFCAPALPAAAAPGEPSVGEAAFLKALGRDAIVVPLWPKGVAPAEPRPELAEAVAKGSDDVAIIHAVTAPTMIVIPPPTGIRPTGLAILCCPGGGYGGLETRSGVQMARWLGAMGGTTVFLKYRVPRRGPAVPKHELPLQDAQRALGLLRSRAKEWALDPGGIGVAGFSAGGHLAAMLSNHHARRTYKPVDEHDRASCRPDFALLVYAAYLTDPILELKPDPALDLAHLSPERTPPTLLTVTRPDKFTVGCVGYFTALRDAKVPAELHVYESGGHGGCFDKYPLLDWGRQAARFLRERGLLDAAAEAAGNDWLRQQEPGVRATPQGQIDRAGGPKAPPRSAARLPALPPGLPESELGPGNREVRKRFGTAAPVYPVWPAGKPPTDQAEDRPTLTVLRPEKPDGRAIVLLPGDGGGFDVGPRLTRLGVTVFLLSPGVPHRDGVSVALQDAQRSISLVRSRAAEFGIDPDWVGVLGLSSGGHVAALCSHQHADRSYKPVDVHDRAPCRPGFAALVSPSGVASQDGKVAEALTGPQRNRVPPLFVADSADDKRVRGALRYVLELREGRVPVAAHIYEHGAERKGEQQLTPFWLVAFERWLNDLGMPTR